MITSVLGRSSDGLTDSQFRTFRRWVMAAGIENVLIFPPVAVPRLYEKYYQNNNRLSKLLRLGGAEGKPPAESVNKMYVNLSGMFGTAIGAALIYSAMDLPHRWGIPVISAITRLSATGMIWYYTATERLSRLVFLTTLADMLFAGVFLYYAARIRSHRPR